MFYLTTHSTHFVSKREEGVVDILKTSSGFGASPEM